MIIGEDESDSSVLTVNTYYYKGVTSQILEYLNIIKAVIETETQTKDNILTSAIALNPLELVFASGKYF